MCDNRICDNLKQGASKKVIFVVGDDREISSFEFSYLNNSKWVFLNSEFISGKYEVNIPNIAQDKVLLKIFINDTSNNSLTYSFEMPTFDLSKTTISYCHELNDQGVAYYLNTSVDSSGNCFNFSERV